jgi:hypothetical protein
MIRASHGIIQQKGVVTPTYPSSLKLFIDAGNLDSYPGSGSTVTDLIGTQNGTLINAVGYNSANGGYFTFNGVDQFIDLGNNATVRTLVARTMSVWMYIDTTASAIGAFYNDTDEITGYKGVLIYYDTQGFKTAICGNSTYLDIKHKITPTTGFWYYLTSSFDGTTYKAYLNGVLINTLSQTVIPTNSTYNSKLGYNSAGFALKGNISQLKIYNTQLSDAEVLTDFNEFKNRYGY